MITGSQTSMLLDWCQGRSTDVSSTSNCAVQPIQWSFADEKWPWTTYDFHGHGFQGCVSIVSLLSLQRHWCIWRHLEAGCKAGCNQNPSRSTKKHTSARRSISSKKFAQPVRVAHGGWVLKIGDVADPKILRIGSMFFPITSFSSENLSFPLVNPREIGKLGMFCYFFGGFVQAVCLNLGHPQNSSRENTSFSDTHPNQEWFKITGIPDWNACLILNIANGVRPLVPHVDPSDRDAFPAKCWNPPIFQSTG